MEFIDEKIKNATEAHGMKASNLSLTQKGRFSGKREVGRRNLERELGRFHFELTKLKKVETMKCTIGELT